MKNIQSTACIHPSSKIAGDVEIGAFSIIHQNVELADGCQIGAYC